MRDVLSADDRGFFVLVEWPVVDTTRDLDGTEPQYSEFDASGGGRGWRAEEVDAQE